MRHGTLGLLLGLLGLLLPVCAFRDTTFPLWWPLIPEDATTTSIGVGTAHSWLDALTATLLGVGWTAILLGLGPGMARLQAAPARRLLAAGPDTDLSLRVAELTATRAADLDAHATELRRIERSLHDGAQNRLVSVTVLLGAARRMVARDPAGADELLERAQSAAEQALAELRSVARGASCRRCWPTGVSRERCPASRRTARCRAASRRTCRTGVRRRWRRRPTSWSPKP
ncbi:hypothetical protein STENM223S_01005 [Streptomyces tendae]